MIRLQETRWVTTFKTMFKFDVFFCSDVNFQDFRDVQVVRLHHPINSRFSGTWPFFEGKLILEIHPFSTEPWLWEKGKCWSFKMVALKKINFPVGWVDLPGWEWAPARHLENSSWRWWRLELQICPRKQTSASILVANRKGKVYTPAFFQENPGWWSIFLFGQNLWN